jgi:hypothetical protein
MLCPLDTGDIRLSLANMDRLRKLRRIALTTSAEMLGSSQCSARGKRGAASSPRYTTWVTSLVGSGPAVCSILPWLQDKGGRGWQYVEIASTHYLATVEKVNKVLSVHLISAEGTAEQTLR